MKIPIRYIGVGEGMDDLLDFDARAFVASLLGEPVAPGNA
jgi:signal recognition particle GTPase